MTIMTATTESAAPKVNLSEPVFTDDEIQFSAFGLGWGFRAYALPAGLVVQQLGAANATERQLVLAFQVNRQRIAHAVLGVEAPESGRRVTLRSV
jgi:hypothetical protein